MVKQNHKHVIALRYNGSLHYEVAVLTIFHSTGEILNTSNRAVVLPFWFIKLHSSPETSRKLCAATELQGSNLRAPKHCRSKKKNTNQI